MKTTIIVIIIFAFISSSNIISQKKSPQYINISQVEVGKRLGEVTEIKGKHIWANEFKGKMVKWTGSILTIEDQMNEFMSKSNNFEVSFRAIPFFIDRYLFPVGEVFVLVIFARKWQSKLLDLKIDSIIRIEGKLIDYSVRAPGIAPTVWLTVSNAKIIE